MGGDGGDDLAAAGEGLQVIQLVEAAVLQRHDPAGQVGGVRLGRPGRGAALGSEHLDTLASQNELAIAYQAAGHATEAIRLHERALTALKGVLGLDHPTTLSSRNNLATAYQAAGRYAEAIPLSRPWPPVSG